MNITTREQAIAADKTDPLAPARDNFILPDGVTYMVGHSLGPPTKAALEAVDKCARQSWANGLVGSWNSAGWFDLAANLGDRLSVMIGAAPGEVMVTDTVSINLFKLAASALPLTQGARQICVDADEFPTDQYIAQSFADMAAIQCNRVEDGGDKAAIAKGGVYIKSAVNYRSGARVDMAGYEALARKSGALIIWDLSHATGVMAFNMHGVGAKLATGCTYKYLNGGPGAPSFIYAAQDLIPNLNTPLPGWMGHAKPFDFNPHYTPQDSAARFASGTPPILSLCALDGALESFDGVDMAALDAKSGALGGLCIARADALGLTVSSPREAAQRGGHVSLQIDNGYPITRALHARGYHTDFRTPDTIRFGFSPLYIRYADVWDVMDALGDLLASGEWDRPEFHARSKVT
ncbi:kynureninase [Robiginitomaculum antarcticum]|uniref:kynureninase n=1 Tax=Robiginitomaculum antarcticum TaxID=437507 RepID=UPI00036A0F67|nr:aminotransferase class V-fold PLP-dependent enzyme [Robiginitomaculum antarcticum]